jgi:ribosomal-protein-alanine N-acetyltransferase
MNSSNNNILLYSDCRLIKCNSFDLLSERDISLLLDLDQLAFPTPWTMDLWHESLREHGERYLVAIKKGENDDLLALGLWSLSEAESLIHLLKIVVAPVALRKGHAQDIAQCVHRLVTGTFERSYLEVEESNKAALKLYQKLGFTALHLIKNFYGPGRNAWSMECRF